MKIWNKIQGKFSFFKENYLILVVSWIMMDFAEELPSTYYPDYVLQLARERWDTLTSYYS